MKRIVIMLSIIALTLISCAPAELQCSVDSDCVPAQCCHATDAVNKLNAPD